MSTRSAASSTPSSTCPALWRWSWPTSTPRHPPCSPDRDAAIVTYCTNPACPNSGQVADRLTGLGYTNVRKYREGIEDWVEAGLPTESA
ncbi:rhodanese-like domain-containing protein [Streptomyces sp. NBC_01198]|uniref:rhodanese-like domain-containing protein n=1 Tax=Streptomyces sp. NBC_01198 TaxID=2903769 RepID=UPI002E165D9A|nr:rhodanese-like domain-containing protein [Streptomyces sp. NBC_01198]